MARSFGGSRGSFSSSRSSSTRSSFGSSSSRSAYSSSGSRFRSNPASSSSYRNTYGVAAIGSYALLNNGGGEGDIGGDNEQSLSCVTKQRYGEKFVVLPKEVNVTTIKDNSTALTAAGVQILDVVVISDCDDKPGRNYVEGALDAVQKGIDSAKLQVVASKLYPAPCLPSRLESRNHYKLADNDNWPLSRVGVRSANEILQHQLKVLVAAELNQNPQFRKGKSGCDRDAFIGTFVPVGVIGLFSLATCLAFRSVK